MKTAILIIGDWSDDGHGKTETLAVEYPESLEHPIGDYYKIAVESGVRDISSFVEGYEESEVDRKVIEDIAEKIGHRIDDLWNLFDDEDDSKTVCLSWDSYSEIWILIANHGIKISGEGPNKIARIKVPMVAIGGYGLFS